MTRSAHAFKISQLDDERDVVAVAGEFDALAVGEFESHFNERSPETPLVVCLSETTLIDSSALGAIIRLNAATNGLVQVHRPRPFQTELFTITGLDDMLATTTDCACAHA